MDAGQYDMEKLMPFIFSPKRFFSMFAVLAALLLFAAAAPAGEVLLEPLAAESALPAADLLPPVEGTAELTLAPEPGTRIVLGNFTQADFAVERPDQIQLADSAGKAIPLFLDASGTGREFAKIVAVRLAFRIPADTVPGATFTLRWGDGVKGQVRELRNLALAPATAGNWSGFRWRAADGAKPSGDLSVASIEIVADSNANYYSLWYLLPMALLFILLTVRKMTGKKTTG